MAIFLLQCYFHERTPIKRSDFILVRLYRLMVHTRKGRNQCVLFNMIEAIEQSTTYVQKSETGAIFCNRNQFSVVTQKHFKDKKHLFRFFFVEVE